VVLKARPLSGLLLLILLSLSFVSAAQAAEDFPATPALPPGKVIRLAYLEAGPFPNYPPNLVAFVKGLAGLGWLEHPNIPDFEDPSDARSVWDWLVKNAKSDKLSFVADGFYEEDWDKEKRKTVKAQLVERLNKKKDIDFVIALGTWAGQDMADAQISTPVMVFSASDPLKAGIVKTNEYSGWSHLHARVDPTRYERQVRLFHDIVGYHRLGVVYENTPEGRTYAAIADVEKIAAEIGFEVFSCFSINQTPDLKLANSSVVECHEFLAPKIDALYITNQTGVNDANMPAMMEPLLKRRIPTFSQPGSRLVKLGALMSIAQAGFKYVGEFHGGTAGKIFNGAMPGDSPKISLNLETAKYIGYNPPVEILVAADEIFQKTEKPEPNHKK
jgi:ABC-type uncharacterized transport system substrate-binding protein